MAIPLGDTEPYYELGSYHRTVATTSAEAQLWFDSTGHGPGVRVQPLRSGAAWRRHLGETDLAIARWGIAYRVGPNYNKAWDAFDPVDRAVSLARAHMELELAAKGRLTAAERGHHRGTTSATIRCVRQTG